MAQGVLDMVGLTSSKDDSKKFDPVVEPLPAGTKPHHEEAIRLAQSDLQAARAEWWYPAPQFLHNLLVEKRDGPILNAHFNCMTMILPAAVGMFFIPSDAWWRHLYGACYMLITWLFFGNRFILGLHYAEHRPLFPRKPMWGKICNSIAPMFLCALWGIPPGFYNLHHVCMHHVENNMFPTDVSSTMPYARDSFLWGYLPYVAKYVHTTTWYLPLYAYRKGRWKQLKQYFTGLTMYATAIYVGWKVNPMACGYVLIGAFIMAAIFLMLGNFSQHLFVDPDGTTNNYQLTFNLIGAQINQWTFNDGYHIVHHEHSTKHWSEMPQEFINKIDTFEKEDAILFKELAYEEVSMLVFTGQMRKLCKYVVQVREKKRTDDELIALLRRRLVKIPGNISLH